MLTHHRQVLGGATSGIKKAGPYPFKSILYMLICDFNKFEQNVNKIQPSFESFN